MKSALANKTAAIEEAKQENEELKAKIGQKDAGLQQQLTDREEVLKELKSDRNELEKKHSDMIDLLSFKNMILAEEWEKLTEHNKVS